MVTSTQVENLIAYIPTNPGSVTSYQEYVRSIQDEDAGQDSTLGQLEILTSAPSSPSGGLIVYADGVGWDPGAGEGWYGYHDTLGVYWPLTGDMTDTTPFTASSWGRSLIGETDADTAWMSSFGLSPFTKLLNANADDVTFKTALGFSLYGQTLGALADSDALQAELGISDYAEGLLGSADQTTFLANLGATGTGRDVFLAPDASTILATLGIGALGTLDAGDIAGPGLIEDSNNDLTLSVNTLSDLATPTDEDVIPVQRPSDLSLWKLSWATLIAAVTTLIDTIRPITTFGNLFVNTTDADTAKALLNLEPGSTWEITIAGHPLGNLPQHGFWPVFAQPTTPFIQPGIATTAEGLITSYVVGIAGETLTFMSDGFLNVVGHGLTVGTPYYLSDTNPGYLTDVKPSNYAQIVCMPYTTDWLLLLSWRPVKESATGSTGTVTTVELSEIPLYANELPVYSPTGRRFVWLDEDISANNNPDGLYVRRDDLNAYKQIGGL